MTRAEGSIVVITGSPSWRTDAERIAQAQGSTVITLDEETGYVARLADLGAALILVAMTDADNRPDPRWRFFTTTPKVSPATRRIPVVVAAVDADTRTAALLAGADEVISPDEIADRLPDLLMEAVEARRAVSRDALRDLCAEPLPPEAEEALRYFNAGEYYRQHDLFEALWMRETRPVRELYRGVLQVGIAYYQIEQGNRRGALKMLLRGMGWLNRLPDVCQGIDVAGLRRDAAVVRAALEAIEDDQIDRFDRRLLKPVRKAAGGA